MNFGGRGNRGQMGTPSAPLDPRQFDPRAMTGLPGTEKHPIIVDHPNADPASNFGGSDIVTGTGVSLMRIRFDRPTPITVYTSIDLKNAANVFYNSLAPFRRAIVDNVTGTQLAYDILGTIKVGMQGALMEADFNIGIGELVEIPVVAESIDLTARLILQPPLVLAASVPPNTFYTCTAWENPPVYQGPQLTHPITATAFAGRGYSGHCNAQRKWTQVIPGMGAAGDFVSIDPPNLACAFRVKGDPTLVVFEEETVTNQVALAGIQAGLVPVNTGANETTELPLAESVATIHARALGAGPTPFAISFRLGFHGIAG